MNVILEIGNPDESPKVREELQEWELDAIIEGLRTLWPDYMALPGTRRRLIQRFINARDATRA